MTPGRSKTSGSHRDFQKALHVRHDVMNHTPPPWTLLSGRQLQFSKEYHENPRTEIAPLLPESAIVSLDVGCGTGATSRFLAARYPGLRCLGLEIQDDARKIATSRLSAVTNHDLMQGPLPETFTPPGSVDLVILLDVLEHMYHPWKALCNLKPVLAEDAVVLISIPNARCLAFLETVASGSFRYDHHGIFDITHVRFFTLGNMIAMLSETGYETLDYMPIEYPAVMMPKITSRSWQHVETENLIVKHGAADGFNDLFAGQYLIKATPVVP